MNDDNSAYRILLAASHDCHERDLLDMLRNGSGQSNSCIFELVYFDLRHSTDFFVVFSLLDRLRSGYFSAVHLVPPAATWSRVRHRTLKWKWFYGFSNKHYVTTASKYKCSWCSLKTLGGRPQRAQRRYGIRSRCDLSAVSVTHRGAQHSCASSLVQTSAGLTSLPSSLAHTQSGLH